MKKTDDILDINPLERMDKLKEIGSEKRKSLAARRKELEELEQSTKKEIESLDNKKRKELEELELKKKTELDNLDKKRKELQDLESKKIKEIEETQDLIERSFQDLMRHKKILLQEEEKQNKKIIEPDTVNLEDMANAANNIMPRGVQGANTNYGRFFESLQTPQKFYEISNSGFYSGLTELRDKAAKGEITSEEELFIERLRSKFEQFNNNESYVERDQNQYIRRSMNVIEQIGNYKRLKPD
ncbi:MAG: hypothetical protein ACP5NW_03250 [Candidatus Woesearchaeota archaeon]